MNVYNDPLLNITQIFILVSYLFLIGMIIKEMRCVVRWARRVSLWAMFLIAGTWAAFYGYAIVWRPLELGSVNL